MEAVKFTRGNSDYLFVRREVKVENGPIVPVRFSTSDRRFRVTQVIVEYRYLVGQWGPSATEVSGPQLKKDGTDGVATLTQRVYFRDTAQEPERWAWLVGIVDALRPAGLPTLPVPGDGA